MALGAAAVRTARAIGGRGGLWEWVRWGDGSRAGVAPACARSPFAVQVNESGASELGAGCACGCGAGGRSVSRSVAVMVTWEAGTRPGGRGTFLLRGKKVPKEARPTGRVPAAMLRGNLRCSRAGCAAELALLLRSAAQTTAASQSTKRGHPSVSTRTPPAALLGTSTGVEDE